MSVAEIPTGKLDPQQFIAEQVRRISETVGDGLAINALSGGVDSSAVTMLGHRALGDRLKTYFIDNALMRAGEPQRIALVREATAITEEELADTGAFQYMAILHEDRVTGMRGGQRDFGLQIEIRCWESVDARTATPTRLPWETLERLRDRILAEVPGVVSVTYNIAPKPPSTMEVV